MIAQILVHILMSIFLVYWWNL